MSTNFYIVDADHQYVAHIGKRSAGWVFMFQACGHKTVQAWRDTLGYLTCGEHIIDECGTSYTPKEFWEAVEATKTWMGEPSKMCVGGYEIGNTTVDEGFTFHNYEFS